MTDTDTLNFSIKVLNHGERLSDYQEEYGDLYNLEATPAESTSYRLAKHDRERYPDIKTAGKPGDTPYYTNSSHLPVGYTEDIFEALDIQDELQTLYTSGTVFHSFLGEKLPDWQAAAKLVRTIAENYRLPYYTLSPTYSVCSTHGYLEGEHFVCSECGGRAEVYSRITGYYRPVQNWNEGKAQEYKNRKLYEIENSRQMSVSTGVTSESQRKSEFFGLSDGLYLFTTKTCPNCNLAKEYLKGLPYTLVDAEENADLATEYSILQAPTLLDIRDGVVNKYVNASNIKKFVEEQLVSL